MAIVPAMMMRLALVFTLAAAGSARAASARCWIDQGAVVVAASFGDIAGDFIVDTAAPVSLLHVTRAQSDGIVENTATRGLIVAGRRVPNLTMTVADLDARTRAFDASINGVIGQDVLRRLDLDLSFAPCRLTLSMPGARPRGALSVSLAGGLPAVSARYSDGVKAEFALFAVSTGQTESLVPAARLAHQPAAGALPPVRLRALSVAGRLFEQTPAGLASGDVGAIGTAVWRGWSRLRLSVKSRWLKLEP